MLDRIDIHLELAAGGRRRSVEDPEPAVEPSAAVRARVRRAHERQLAARGKVNRDLDERDLRAHCRLDGASRELLETAVERLGLSERGSGRVLRVARTIADLAGDEQIASTHLAEAITLRRFDRRP